MALIDIPLPRLLDASGVEISRIYPLHASVTINKTPLSIATIDLPAGETLPPRAWVEMYTALGSAGIFRVYSPQTAYGDQTCNVQLDHGVVEIGDYIIRTAVESDMSARNAFTTIFSNYRGTLWRLGTVEATETVSVDIDGESVLEAILATMDSLPDYYLDLDQSSRPWTLNVRHMPTTVSAEGRLDRNVESATITPDGSSQVTRLYIEGLPNGYIESDNIGTVGPIERTLYIGGDNLTPESVVKLQQEAQRYIDKHKVPLQSISISGYDFSAITGESLDQIGICKLYRLALADYNTVISANITSYSFDDVYDNPYSVSITLDEEEAGITASLQHLQNESSGGSGGGKKKKKDEKKFKQYETKFEKTDERMALIATESEWDEAAQEGHVTFFTEMERTARYVTEAAYQELPYDDWKAQTQKADPTADVSQAAYQRWIAANPYAIYNYEYIDATRTERIINKTGINSLGQNETLTSRISANADNITAEVTRATTAEGNLSGRINVNANNITAEVTRATTAEGNLSGRISVNADNITAEVTRATGAESSLSGRITTEAGKITQIVQAVGSNGQVTAASIVAAVNSAGSSVVISADHIELDGQTVASSLVGYNVDVAELTASNLEVLGGMTVDQSVTCDAIIANGITLDGADVSTTYNAFRFVVDPDVMGQINLQGKSLGDQANWEDLANFNMADTHFFQAAVSAARNGARIIEGNSYVQGTMTLQDGDSVTLYPGYYLDGWQKLTYAALTINVSGGSGGSLSISAGNISSTAPTYDYLFGVTQGNYLPITVTCGNESKVIAVKGM